MDIVGCTFKAYSDQKIPMVQIQRQLRLYPLVPRTVVREDIDIPHIETSNAEGARVRLRMCIGDLVDDGGADLR